MLPRYIIEKESKKMSAAGLPHAAAAHRPHRGLRAAGGELLHRPRQREAFYALKYQV